MNIYIKREQGPNPPNTWLLLNWNSDYIRQVFCTLALILEF